MRFECDRLSTVSIRVALIIGFLISTLATGLAWEQQNRAQQPAKSVTPPSADPSSGVLVSPDEDYRLAAGDVIEVLIEDAPELSSTFRINTAGTLLMPYLGRITAQQKTTEELSKLIADGLRGRYLTNPTVTVLVRQYNSRSFFIQGAVRNPGVYQIEGRPSLLKLVTIAGGLSDNHGSTAFVIRQVKPLKAEDKDQERKYKEPGTAVTAAQLPSSDAQSETQDEAETEAKYELKKVNINSLLQGRFDQNVLLEAGDFVNIPTTEVFFVAGEVNAPGSFPLKEGMTLRQAISLAQGITFRAVTSRGIIFREDPGSSQRREIQVDIGAIMKGKKGAEDVMILSNDVIIVPNSRMKKILEPMLTAFGVNAARLPVRY